jgi:hypothetical protein
MRTHRYSIWKQLAVFVALGPPVGAFALLLWARLVGKPPIPFDPRSWLFIAFPVAYTYAGLPALVTGYCAALIRSMAPGEHLLARSIRFGLPLLVGSVTSVIFLLVTLGSEPEARTAAVGALAALVCTAVVEWRVRLRPNKSFKPNPLRGSA